MPEEIRDPVSRVRQRFATRGESLVVDNWLEPGGVLPPHLHPAAGGALVGRGGRGALPAR